jgi:hypothetical protein
MDSRSHHRCRWWAEQGRLNLKVSPSLWRCWSASSLYPELGERHPHKRRFRILGKANHAGVEGTRGQYEQHYLSTCMGCCLGHSAHGIWCNLVQSHSTSSDAEQRYDRDGLDAASAGWAYSHGGSCPSHHRGRTPETIETNSRARWIRGETSMDTYSRCCHRPICGGCVR